MAADIKDWSANDLENLMLDDINLSREQGGEVAKLMGAIKRKFDDVDLEIAGVAGAYTYKGTVDTVADLPETGNQVGDVYNVTTGDAQGNYAWDGAQWDKTGDSLVDVDGAQVLAKGSTTKRTLGKRFADVVNVKDFGAVGDGVANDVAAFAAASAVSDTIYVPKGTYYLPTQPSWAAGKNVVLYSASDNVVYTGNWGANRVGTQNRGLTFRQVNSAGDSNRRNVLTIYQSFNDTAEKTASDGVRGAIYVRSSMSPGHKKATWAITGIAHVSNTDRGSEGVGGFFLGERVQDPGHENEYSLTPTWGAVLDAHDKTEKGSPGALVGVEVDCCSNGDCTNDGYNKVGVDIRGSSHSLLPTFVDGEGNTKKNILGYGCRVAVGMVDSEHNGGDTYLATAKFHAGFELGYGEFDYGIHIAARTRFYGPVVDLRNATFALGVEAVGLHLANGHKIVFGTGTNSPILYNSGSALVIDYNGKHEFISAANGIGVRSVALYKYTTDASGNETHGGTARLTGNYETGTASASFSASNKPGTQNATAPYMWLKVEVDGTPFWLPLFAN